jgi:hypothetical protein
VGNVAQLWRFYTILQRLSTVSIRCTDMSVKLILHKKVLEVVSKIRKIKNFNY